MHQRLRDARPASVVAIAPSPQGAHAAKLAYDRPSQRCLAFLRTYFNLARYTARLPASGAWGRTAAISGPQAVRTAALRWLGQVRLGSSCLDGFLPGAIGVACAEVQGAQVVSELGSELASRGGVASGQGWVQAFPRDWLCIFTAEPARTSIG